MTAYIGRFAPSPTGALHFGSLVAALASYCDAKFHQGQWRLRIEDVDQSREVNGAALQIMHTLNDFGFEWDGNIIYQSERIAIYEAAIKTLAQKKLIYPCTCSRKEISDASLTRGIEGLIYPKTCLNQPLKEHTGAALRIKTPNETTHFYDAIQGEISQNLANDSGDFVLQRADKVFNYQLAVVVDDAALGITHVVRGADLLHSTPRQLYLQQQLTFHQPIYAHIPIAYNAQGEKLSKQTLATPIHPQDAQIYLYKALQFLKQSPPSSLQSASIPAILAWGISHWTLSNMSSRINPLQNQ